MSEHRWIYPFDHSGEADRQRLGGKGAGLAEMTRLGLPVPAGFTITTEACTHFLASSQQWPAGLQDQLEAAVVALEATTGRRFGDADAPLLVSVRSGAAVSMPGMMDTVLNLGLNRQTTEALARATANPRFAWDSYRRFVQMFADVVLGIHYTRFHRVQEAFLAGRSLADLDAEALEQLCGRLEAEVAEVGAAFPTAPRDQLHLAIDAVFRSYNSHRARYYRKTHRIADDAGTAVNVQQMVFGNMGGASGTGVAFTRDPEDGRGGACSGSGCPTPRGRTSCRGSTPRCLLADLADRRLPEVYQVLEAVQQRLEAHYRDMQDIEFTIESGRLFLLQTRSGKRSAAGGGADRGGSGLGGGHRPTHRPGAGRSASARVHAAARDQPRRQAQGDREGARRVARGGHRAGGVRAHRVPGASTSATSPPSWSASRPPPRTSRA